MFFSDIFIVVQWWTVLFAIGIAFLPLTSLIFPKFFDKGYIFAKVIGIVFISYTVFVLGFLKILPFTEITIILVSFVFLILNILLISKSAGWRTNLLASLKKSWQIFCFEEILFLGVLFFWSFIRAHQPDIHGLEKYMDYGFINSILRTKYFPPLDMWFTPYPINYYYFGHLVTAVLTKISNIPSSTTFNLMLSTISGLTFVGAFSIGANLIHAFLATTESQKKHEAQKFSVSKIFSVSVIAGFLSGLIITFGGNLHTLYLFFKPYVNDNPVPFWQLAFSPQTFPNNYWYPNATRFIENTIHEFPIYSSVVSDLHGHFFDIPFVLLTIAILLSLINSKLEIRNSKFFGNFNFGYLKLFRISDFGFRILLLGFILAIMYMTNVWDGFIYFLLSSIIIGYLIYQQIHNSKSTQNYNVKLRSNNVALRSSKFKTFIKLLLPKILLLGLLFFLFSLPFNLNFKPFASGIGILCSPKFLTDIGNFGPFLFESNHCQKSPLWQLLILYGFFYFWVISFLVMQIKNQKSKIKNVIQNSKLFKNLNFINNLSPSDIFVIILIILSTLLIIIPEFIYVKDIYPAHYRANTMFKLVYQSFIMLSLTSGYIIVRLISNFKLVVLVFIGSIGLFLVMAYPYFAINSYFGNLKNYSGLNGTKYLKALYPSDYEAILWINKNIKDQPVILEAQGDSYTDFARVSANTGLPTVLGWTVHEWLWRGTYDIPSPRIEEVTQMYESKDLEETKKLLNKYNVALLFIGDLERQKYPNLNENKFKSLGKIIYQKGGTKIFEVTIR